MKKTNINSADQDQKLIEDHVYLEIEDKGNIVTEKVAAVEEPVANEFVEPAKKKGWSGWWVAALFALLAIGCCIYFATRDAKKSEIRTAQNAAVGSKHAPFTALKGFVAESSTAMISAGNDAADAVGNAAGKTTDTLADAGSAVKGTVDNAVNSVKGVIDGVSVYGKYPKASCDLVDQEAADGRRVDYLYYFANNVSAVPENAVLNDIAEAAANTGADITITAYASPTGSAAYNEALCEKRAENIENYLEAHGVSADHIKIVSGGQTDQFGSDAYNRRADILVNYGA